MKHLFIRLGAVAFLAVAVVACNDTPTGLPVGEPVEIEVESQASCGEEYENRTVGTETKSPCRPPLIVRCTVTPYEILYEDTRGTSTHVGYCSANAHVRWSVGYTASGDNTFQAHVGNTNGWGTEVYVSNLSGCGSYAVGVNAYSRTQGTVGGNPIVFYVGSYYPWRCHE